LRLGHAVLVSRISVRETDKKIDFYFIGDCHPWRSERLSGGNTISSSCSSHSGRYLAGLHSTYLCLCVQNSLFPFEQGLGLVVLGYKLNLSLFFLQETKLGRLAYTQVSRNF
jgi:hypothetical protein